MKPYDNCHASHTISTISKAQRVYSFALVHADASRYYIMVIIWGVNIIGLFSVDMYPASIQKLQHGKVVLCRPV